MIIYGALLIPFIAAFVLYKFYNRNITWWELLIPFGVSLILVFIMKLIIGVIPVKSKEYWGSIISEAKYYEQWDEWIEATCSYQCSCDEKGNNCQTVYYDCSYRSYHPPYWIVNTTTDETISIAESQYLYLKKLYSNQSFIELNRDYYRIDGDSYITVWPKDSATSVPATTIHYYENRIKKGDQSIFHFEKVSKDDIVKFDLKQYPKLHDNYVQDAVIGDSSKDALLANEKVKYINGLLGSKKEVKCFILIFKNQPVEAALYQEWLWSGGNMNELVVCIGINNERLVKWCKVFSWTTAEKIKADIREQVQQKDTLDLVAVSRYLQTEIDSQFKRRDFEEFNYITVSPPAWSIILTYILTLLANYGVYVWAKNNEYN